VPPVDSMGRIQEFFTGGRMKGFGEPSPQWGPEQRLSLVLTFRMEQIVCRHESVGVG